MLSTAKYRAACNECRHLVTEFEKEKNRNTQITLETFISTPTKTSINNDISPLIYAYGKLLTDDFDKATVLNILIKIVSWVSQTTVDNSHAHRLLLTMP